MVITTLSSRDFNQDTSGAKRAAEKGPVFITDRGKPAHVLLSIEDYQRLIGQQTNIVDLLGMSDGEDIDFNPPKLNLTLRPADIA